MEVPVMCRQSDIKRAKELVAELTNKIVDGKFLLNNCL